MWKLKVHYSSYYCCYLSKGYSSQPCPRPQCCKSLTIPPTLTMCLPATPLPSSFLHYTTLPTTYCVRHPQHSGLPLCSPPWHLPTPQEGWHPVLSGHCGGCSCHCYQAHCSGHQRSRDFWPLLEHLLCYHLLDMVYSIYLDNTNIMSIHNNMLWLTGNDTRCPLPDTNLSPGHLLPELCPSTAGIPTVIPLGGGGGWLSKLWVRMTWDRGWVVWPNMIYDYDRGGW